MRSWFDLLRSWLWNESALPSLFEGTLLNSKKSRLEGSVDGVHREQKHSFNSSL